MTATARNIVSTSSAAPASERGNILIYVLMTTVIFAVIGVTMVSLFSTSISSSATANETRRAFYLSESGIRSAAERAQAERVLAGEHRRPRHRRTTRCRRRAT